MTQDEFEYRLMEMMHRDERKPIKQKHYGFGLPKSYRVIDAENGEVISSFGYSEIAYETATEQSERTGHRFEIRAIWR